jgi:hypothetical protein
MIGAEHLFIDDQPPSRLKLISRGLLALMVTSIFVFLAFDRRKTEQRNSQRQPVPCTIRTSTAERSAGVSEKPYVFTAHLDYKFQDWPYTARETRSSDNAAEIFALTRTHSSGSSATCWVHPQQPTDATLKTPQSGTGDFLGVLAFASVLGLYAITQFARCIHPPTWQTWRKSKQRLGLTLLVILMIAAAVAAFVWFFAIPIARAISASQWPKVECEIVSVSLITEKHHGEVPFTTWKPDILYRYQVGGVLYHSNDYRATELSSPWFYGKRNITRRYSPAMRANCYVNPADPADSVLTHTFSPTVGFALWPLIIAMIAFLAIQEWRREAKLPPSQVAEWKKRRDRRVGRLALLVGAVSCAAMFIFFGTDLVRDWRVGTATATEIIVTVITALTAGILAYFCGRLGLRPRLTSLPASKTD